MTVPPYPVVEAGVVVDDEVDDDVEVESEFEVEAGVDEDEISGVVIVVDTGGSFVVGVMDDPVVGAPTNACNGMLAPLISIIE